MKISKKLPQFDDKKILIVATGKLDAVIYRGGDGHLKKVIYFEVPVVPYTDREGHFKKSGRGQTYGSGSVLKEDKSYYIDKFLGKLNENLKKINTMGLDEFYLFCPDYMVNDVREALPARLKDKVSHTFKGNYVNHEPIKLLEMIGDLMKEEKEKDKKNIKKEAKKILKKSKIVNKNGK